VVGLGVDGDRRLDGRLRVLRRRWLRGRWLRRRVLRGRQRGDDAEGEQAERWGEDRHTGWLVALS
jgi:hypothetical protein